MVIPYLQNKPVDEDADTDRITFAVAEFLETTKTAEETAFSISSQIFVSQSIDTSLSLLWHLLIEFAEETPRYQPQLLELLKAIQGLPRQSGETRSKDIVWRILPNFASTLRDSYTRGLGSSFGNLIISIDPSFLGRWASRNNVLNFNAKRWQALNEFHARLVADGSFFGVGAQEWLGLSALRIALETKPTAKSREEPADAKVMLLEVEMPAVEAWLKHAGKQLLHTSDEVGVLRESPGLWTGDPGISEARWDFWRARLYWVKDCQMCTPEVRDSARRALTVLENLSSWD